VQLQREFSTTLPRFDLLAALYRRAEGVTMSELSASLRVSNGNVTVVATRLIQDELIAKITDPRDRRASILCLTPRGRRMFARMAHEHEVWVTAMFDDLTVNQCADLMELLGTLRQSIEANPL